MASGPASLPGPPASPPELTETHLLQSTAANLSFAADAAAGMPLPCPSWESGAEYFVCKAYNGEECTDSGDSAETGYLACRIGDCVTLLSGIAEAGHAGNQEQWYVFAVKKTTDTAVRGQSPGSGRVEVVASAPGWIPCSILGARCYRLADELSLPPKSRPPSRPVGQAVTAWSPLLSNRCRLLPSVAEAKSAIADCRCHCRGGLRVRRPRSLVCKLSEGLD